MSINLLRNARIRNSKQCRYDTNEGYSVYWDSDGEFNGYTSFEGVTARLVSNGSYFMTTTTSSGYISTSEDIVSIDAGVYSKLRINMRIEPGVFHVIPTRGRIQFKASDDVDWDPEKIKEFTITPDNAYRDYDIDMSTEENWQGDIVRLRLYPIMDGDAGQQIFVRYLKAISSTVFSCSTRFNSPVCSRFTEYTHTCPFRGAGAIAISDSVSDRLTIVKGVNDKLLFNINSFGQQAITLEPVVNATLDSISRDIEYKLNLIGIGGYAQAQVDVVNNAFVVEADTPSSTSAIEISQPAESSAGETLGFFDSAGNSTHTTVEGVEAASRYEPEGTYRINRDDLDQFYVTEDTDTDDIFSIDPTRWATQAGREDYLHTNRDTTFSFDDKTFIDYNNPITENGVLLKAFFSGTANKATEFRVYRQSLDGTIYYVAGVNFGSSSNNNSDKVFEVDCSIRVQRGDLIGLYDASFHTGKDTESSNFSYYLYDGNLLTSTSALKLQGQGEEGAPLFCRGAVKTNKAAIILEFDNLEPIEAIEVQATEETPFEEMRLTDVRGGGVNGGPGVSGYTGYDLEGNKAPEWTNLYAITDGDKLDKNGVSEVAYPLWIDGVDADRYDFTEAGIVIDFAPGIDVLFNIYKVIVYFKNDRNIKHFSVDYPQNTNLLGTVRTWQVVTPQFSEVHIDGLLSPDTRYFYSNPCWVTAPNYSEDYINLKYKTLEFNFDPVSSRAIRFRGYLNRDSDALDYNNTETLADFPIYVDPSIQEIEVFGKSTPLKNLSDNFAIFSSTDGELYTEHGDEDALSSTSTRFTVGYPVKFLKLLIEPTSLLTVRGISASISREDSLIITNQDSAEEHMLDVPKNNPDSTEDKIVVRNETEETSNYYVDIADEHNKDVGLILWNKLGSSDELENSEYGPGGVVYKRPNFKFSITNVALGAPAYVMDPNFLVNSECYVSYDMGASWEDVGNIIVNGSKLDYLTDRNSGWNTYSKVYAAVKCNDAYDFEQIKLVNKPLGIYDYGWSTSIFYSTANVDSPSDIPDSGPYTWTQIPTGARWIRMSVDSHSSSNKSLAYIIPILDIGSQVNYGKTPWKLESRLTNGIAGGKSYEPEDWIESGKIQYYCVDLEKKFDIEGVVLGPLTSDYSMDNDAFLETENILSGGSNSKLAFSGTDTDDPNKVRWSSFGAPVSGGDRWMLINTSLCDEIGVFVNDESSLNKTVFEIDRWWSGRNTTPYIDTNNYCVPFGSAAVDYPAGSSTYDYLEVAAPMGVDNELQPRDAFSFCLYVEDVSMIDRDYGYFRLGKATSESSSFNGQHLTKDEDNFYVWDFDTISSGIVNGWNFVTLQFFRSNEVGNTRFVENISGSTSSTKKRSRFHNFKFQFKGTGTNDQFKVALDNFEILRAFYPEGEFGNGLYLAGNDYLKFPMNNFNHAQGSIEFFLDPDWSKDTNCNNCTDMISHTIFRFMNPFGYYMTLLMTTSGMQVFLSNGTNTLTHIDNSYGSLISGQRHHFAFTWDFDSTSASIFQIYIDGTLSSEFFKDSLQGDFDLRGMTNTYLLFGGKTWAGYSTKEVSGLDGVVDNVKVYNYPKRDFKDSLLIEDLKVIRKSRDLIKLSLDGVTFYGYEDRGAGLPLLVRNIAPGAEFSFFVKARELDSLKDGETNRKTLVEVVRSNAG